MIIVGAANTIWPEHASGSLMTSLTSSIGNGTKAAAPHANTVGAKKKLSKLALKGILAL